MSELNKLVAEGAITAQAVRSMLRQGWTPAQIVKGVVTPAVAT